MYLGHDVIFAKNFTDIDDKILDKANDLGVAWQAIAEDYIKEYYIDARGLGELPPTHEPRATGHIPGMLKIVKKLLKNNFAYTCDGSVYMRAKKVPDYGRLSGKILEDLQAGARVAINENKEDELDFVLWKAAKPGEPYWESEWGNGRPGWHIECTAMIDNIFGDTIDIHCGGQDLIFPHHENELAQYVAYCNKPLARYWIHNGFVTVDSEKMAKSVGNFFTVRQVADEFGYLPIRLMSLQAHYRSPINYSIDVMKQNLSALQRLSNCVCLLTDTRNKIADTEGAEQPCEELETLKNKFLQELDDDFNTAGALGVLFDLVKQINLRLTNTQSYDINYVVAATKIMQDFLFILGLDLSNFSNQSACEDEQVQELVRQREIARASLNFQEADRIRDNLQNMGICLEDTQDGVKIKRDPGGVLS
jgi:cysteinyl-tRNA synthetase